MASRKNKNLIFLVLGGIALYMYLKKKKDKAPSPVKPVNNEIVSSRNYASAAESVSQAIDKMNFLPANNSDRSQYAKDQKFCK